MKKLTKKVLPVVLAGVMVFGMAVPSMAATEAETIPVDFVTEWNADGTIKDIDMERYSYYLAAQTALKGAPAFTSDGTVEEVMTSENNLYGTGAEAYGFTSELVWDLEAGGAAGVLHQLYGTWDNYVAKSGVMDQAALVDSITHLADLTKGDTAKYWYVRHGSLDRDTSFANQTLLYAALLQSAEKEGTDVNFKFAYGKGHSGNYDNAEAYAYFTEKTDAVTGDTAVVPANAETTKAIEYTFEKADGTSEKQTVNVYTYHYLAESAINDKYLPESAWDNAKVNIYVPAGATADTPVLYMVDNSGWRSDSYKELLVADGTEVKNYNNVSVSTGYSANGTSQEDLAAMALNDGYIVINAGLRSRADEGYNPNSPVTVADAKAVIMYVRSLGLGADMWISGTSGGGALSVAVAAGGNIDAYADELENIGAVTGYTDEVQGTIAYCPITDLGHADGAYEFTFAKARTMLLAAGYTSDTKETSYVLSESTMTVSPKLAYEWADYVDSLGIVVGGKAITANFDTTTLTGFGTLYDLMKAEIIKSLNEGVAKAGGKDAFLKSLEGKTYATTAGKMGGFYVKAEADDKNASPKTGEASYAALLGIVVAFGAVAIVGTRKRELH